MAQNQNRSNSQGICKKFYKKLSTSSHNSKKATLPKLLPDRKQPATTSTTTTTTTSGDHSAVGDNQKAGSRQQHVLPRRQGGAKAPAKVGKSDEGKFSDYIRKVKEKMRRSFSTVGAAKTETKRDSFDDKVSRFIDRAKSKMRRTSDVGVAEKKSTV